MKQSAKQKYSEIILNYAYFNRRMGDQNKNPGNPNKNPGKPNNNK
jgi:hypothetical protein